MSDEKNMKLNQIACPGCGRSVHDQAVACPECGEMIYVEHPGDITPTKHPPIEFPKNR